MYGVYGYNFNSSERRLEIVEEELARDKALREDKPEDIHNPKQDDRLFDMETKYSDFLHNRQFRKDDERFRRRPDDIDGTFRDVGYR